MSREKALALVQQLLDAAGHRDIPRLMELYADEAVATSPVFGEVRGRAGIATTWETLFSTFADVAVEISNVLVDGDRIAVLTTLATTDRVGWFGRPATSPDGRLVYSNAAHNPPVLVARDGIHRLTTGGPILGAFGDAAFEEETLHLHAQDTLVMFTDGVTEARNAVDEEFGEHRLMACLSTNARSSPTFLLDRIFGAVREFCQKADQSDDITVTITRFFLPHRTRSKV